MNGSGAHCLSFQTMPTGDAWYDFPRTMRIPEPVRGKKARCAEHLSFWFPRSQKMTRTRAIRTSIRHFAKQIGGNCGTFKSFW